MKRFLIPSLLLILTLVACDGGTNNKKRVSGAHNTTDSAPYELLVVGDKDWLQTTDGSMLMDVVTSEIPGLPQSESNFKVLSINPAGFSKTYKGFANIVFFEISSKYQKAEMKVAKDVYAHPQIIVYLTAPNGTAMAQLAQARKQQIIDMFVNADLKRERDYLKNNYSGKVLSQVQKQFGCSIYVPQDINAIKTGKDFMWASSNQVDNRLNICVYSFPYTAEEDFSRESFIAHRDSFMRKNIEGAKPNQYMSTDADLVFTRQMMFEGRFVEEARGLWEMENDMMGGPFISYSQVDTVKNRVIVVEGFVYAPDKKKRPFIREMEATIQTFKFGK